MKQRKPMRTFFWNLLLVLMVVGFFVVLIRLIIEKRSFFASEESSLLIVAPLYVAAWYFVPKLKLLQPVSTASTVSAEENTMLSTPARLTIIRDNSIAGAAMAIMVYLDNEPACEIKNGESFTIKLTMKHSVLRSNIAAYQNPCLNVTAPDGGVGEVHMKCGAFIPKTLKWN